LIVAGRPDDENDFGDLINRRLASLNAANRGRLVSVLRKAALGLVVAKSEIDPPQMGPPPPGGFQKIRVAIGQHIGEALTAMNVTLATN
jgi:hypothetical protein